MFSKDVDNYKFAKKAVPIIINICIFNHRACSVHQLWLTFFVTMLVQTWRVLLLTNALMSWMWSSNLSKKLSLVNNETQNRIQKSIPRFYVTLSGEAILVALAILNIRIFKVQCSPSIQYEIIRRFNSEIEYFTICFGRFK